MELSGYFKARLRATNAHLGIAAVVVGLAAGASLWMNLDYHDTRGTLVVVVSLLAICWAGLTLKKVAERHADPLRHPSARSLSSYGDVEKLMQSIDGEVAQTGGGQPFGDTRLLGSWLMQSTWFRERAVPLFEVVWVYKEVIKSSYRAGPVMKSHMLTVQDSHGKYLPVSASEPLVDSLLAELTRRCPWALVGNSSQVTHSMLGKQRQETVSAILERRRGYTTQTGAA